LNVQRWLLAVAPNKRTKNGQTPFKFALEMPARGELVVHGLLANEGINLAGKIRKYGSRMDLADACVLRLAELVPGSVVITLDKKDFGIYRMHRDDQVTLLHP
jgi:hypothetical protein